MLALLLLIGSVGLPVSRHYCMGQLKSVAVFAKAKKCHAEQERPHCPFHPTAPTEDDRSGGCCDDEQELAQIDDQEQAVSDNLPTVVATASDFPPQLFAYRPPHPRLRKDINFENYRPPPLLPDPVREFQVFRL